MRVLLVLLLALSFFQASLNDITPLVEDSFEVSNHFGVWILGGLDVSGFVFPLSLVLFQVNIVLETSQSLFQFGSELVKDLLELLFLFLLALTPVVIVQGTDEWFIDRINNGVEGVNGMF